MHFRLCFYVIFFVLAIQWAGAGVTNPDISAIGQIQAGYTDDSASVDKKQTTLTLGETELVFNAALNPYFNGFFTFSIGEDGLEVEEAYTTLVRGLPLNLNMKSGKYRLPFGKLNPLHPHAYPFVETPRVLKSMLPGEEGFNEVALEVSVLMPLPGDWASILSADVLQGQGFHPDQEKTKLAGLVHWGNSFLIGDMGALEIGFSGTHGTNDVVMNTQSTLLGVDAKTKLTLSPTLQLVLQGEFLYKSFESGDTATGIVSDETRSGFYSFADFRIRTHYEAGILYDQYQQPGDGGKTDRAVKVFAGYAVLEESALLRAGYEHFVPDGGQAVNTLSLQLLFSMGPHKPHTF